MKTALFAIGTGILTAAQICVGNAVAMDNLRMTHSVYLGGLFMGSVDTEIDQSVSGYTVNTTAKTNENMRWMFSWAAKGATMGDVSGIQVQPVQHTHLSRWKGKERGADIKYSPDGKVSYTVSGKKSNNPNKYTNLDPEAVHNSLDPMSMILAATLEFEKTNVCEGRYPVFDGRRRYDVILTDGGSRNFSKSNYSVFEGKAIGCKLDIVEKGGFKKDKDYDLAKETDLVIWVAAPAPGGRVVPVRMQVDTGFGKMELHLERYQHGNAKLASKNAQ